jgi:hypothetical protein
MAARSIVNTYIGRNNIQFINRVTDIWRNKLLRFVF